jgi:uncharacterized membrane protein YphA (DoxX/SURF4 family)
MTHVERQNAAFIAIVFATLTAVFGAGVVVGLFTRFAFLASLPQP